MTLCLRLNRAEVGHGRQGLWMVDPPRTPRRGGPDRRGGLPPATRHLDQAVVGGAPRTAATAAYSSITANTMPRPTGSAGRAGK
jgi:hypothetical protein